MVGIVGFFIEEGYIFSGENSFNFLKFCILGIGFILDLYDMKVDLSCVKNIFEVIVDGCLDDFIGVYIFDGFIGFFFEWGYDFIGLMGELFVYNFLVGIGGIFGIIGLCVKLLVFLDFFISVKFGDKFKVFLMFFDMIFQQNVIIELNIVGILEIFGFKDVGGDQVVIDIKIYIGMNGDFNIIVSEQDGIEFFLYFDEYFRIVVNSFIIGRCNGKFFFVIVGVVDFNDVIIYSFFIGNNLLKDIEI